MSFRLLWFIAWFACCLLAALSPVAIAQRQPSAPASPEVVRDQSTSIAQYKVLFIATSNVAKGKFRGLAPIAAAEGVSIEARYLAQIPAKSNASLFAGYDAVFIDSYLHEEVQAHLADALPGLKAPNVWLYEKNIAWGGMDQATAHSLLAYYSNGGEQNFRGFFKLLAARLRGQAPPRDMLPPVVFPKVAAYHPRLPGLLATTPDDYWRWARIDPHAADRPPVIGVLIHQQYISAMQTGFVDDLVTRIEASGAQPLVIYAPVMEPDSLAAWLRPDAAHPATVDALINTQIMLDAQGRRHEFERFGVPVIQAMPYRKGDEAAWRADPQGVGLMDVPFYFAQSEYAGVFDIQVAAATRKDDDAIVAIAAQADAVVGKALNLARLRRTANSDKRIALMFWNYPPGEKNLSASFLNVPRSLHATIDAMRQAGYDVPAAPDQARLVADLQRLLAPHYRDGLLAALVDDGLAALLPVTRYRAWLDGLPRDTRDAMLSRWGDPAASAHVIRRDGDAYFVIPRLQLGKLALLPQSPRAERSGQDREKALYHTTKADALPSHAYFATYLWVREGTTPSNGHHALIHYGTHGNQEWLPGKERALDVHDAPMLAVGGIPVVYPYIVDNVGEAIQARRRGRAVTISHQTPPFKPAGLYQQLTHLHDLLHQWLAQEEGAVKAQLRTDLLAAATSARVVADMGWTEHGARAQFAGFAEALHAHLHELADSAQPLGLHAFGIAPADEHRAATVMLMLGKPFAEAAGRRAGVAEADLDEAYTGDYAALAKTTPYRMLKRYVIDQEDATGLPDALRTQLEKAAQYWQALGAQKELPALLSALAGNYTPTSYGGDPLKNPDAYPTGRNLYGFDPSRVPTPQAWAAGKQAAEDLIAAHRKQAGATPTKLAVSLWSVETMRHQGMLEAQALQLLGVEPVWDDGGRVSGVKLIPRAQLGRPRVDVVLSVTGLYRDHFPNVMKQLARAAQLAAEADTEADNAVAANTRRIEQDLRVRGLPEDVARSAAQTRIFSAETGRYGSGLDDAVLATDSWKGKAEGDRKLAQLYLDRMQYAYGPDEATWGNLPQAGQDAAGNLYAAHLRGTQGAVLSRTSNTYGMLTTDDPFQYLGGIALAVRHLDGRAPRLYISNLRGDSGRVEEAAQFLAKELATRQFHPGYIKGLMAEGYAGTLQVLDATNNFWGWTAVAREIVRDDQWQEMVEVYVRDKHRLGLREWFERDNPHALAQTIERMLEAERQGYWKTDAATIVELKSRWRDLSARFDVQADNAAFGKAVADIAPAKATARLAGYGLPMRMARAATSASSPPASLRKPTARGNAKPPESADASSPLEAVTGIRLERRLSAPHPTSPVAQPLGLLLALLALMTAGAGRQARNAGIAATRCAKTTRIRQAVTHPPHSHGVLS